MKEMHSNPMEEKGQEEERIEEQEAQQQKFNYGSRDIRLKVKKSMTEMTTKLVLETSNAGPRGCLPGTRRMSDSSLRTQQGSMGKWLARAKLTKRAAAIDGGDEGGGRGGGGGVRTKSQLEVKKEKEL